MLLFILLFMFLGEIVFLLLSLKIDLRSLIGFLFCNKLELFVLNIELFLSILIVDVVRTFELNFITLSELLSRVVLEERILLTIESDLII